MTRIHDLLDLPESVQKGDFVQSLSGGLEQPEATVQSYAITASIVMTFRQALKTIDSALATGRSQAAYLHGSFGSGKSHFMTVLDLMLSDDPAPWQRGELHALKGEFPWIGKKKLLQLPMHFLDANSVEGKIFESYVRWLEVHEPDAPVPALFADAELFQGAAAYRADIGDEAFFGNLNAGQPATGGWGKRARAGSWDADRFEAAIAGTDESERGALFSALVRLPVFVAFSHQTDQFIELDRGLQVLCRHAQSLGYDAVIFLLDELVLWLAGLAHDAAFINREAEKLVKLVEAQHQARAIPLVSFIARQRDLGELVGERLPGSQRAALDDSLKHHEDRFATIPLQNSNLPAIVAHRVVRAKNDAARQQLDDGFAKVWRQASDAKSTLIGTIADEAGFRKVFPFSPALVEALVALSDCLQRERTALRILMELLVDHLKDLELGPIVPVGDAFDVIAGGEDPFDRVMKDRFDRARHLYNEDFLPIIRADNNTDTAEKCQRLRPEHSKRLGCSGCPERTCRNDNRLAKTLLMAALVPEAPTFKDLTVKKLVHLNHGAIASPIPGAEIQLAAEKVRRWQAQIGPLRVGDERDPVIHLHLQGIDLAPILQRADENATPGASKQALRRLLFGALELATDSSTVEASVIYRGIRRKGNVALANVRELSDAKLRCPPDVEWQVIFDYPFDSEGLSPEDDLARVEQFRELLAGEEEATLVWLPTFFNHEMEKTLEDYVKLEYILDGRTPEFLGHLRQEDQVQARGDIRSLRDQKQEQLLRALAAAYAITQATERSGLDPSRSIDDHVIPLAPSLTVPPPLAGKLSEGLSQVVECLLGHRYPHHPRFGPSVTRGKLERVLELIERLVESPDRRIPVTVQDRTDLRAISDPLGLTKTTEQAAILEEKPLSDMEQRRAQAQVEPPTVRDVRGYADPDGYKGLTPELQDFMTWAYAYWYGRTIVNGGRDVTDVKLGHLPEDAELIRPELPSEEEWHGALDIAAEALGATFANRHRSAHNLAAFNRLLDEKAQKLAGAAQLVGPLEEKLREWAGGGGGAPRATTARSAAALVSLIEHHEGAERVRQLAAFTAETSRTSVARSLVSVAQLLTELRGTARWLNFVAVRNLLSDPGKRERARHLLEDLATALRADEVNAPLLEALAELTRRAGDLMGSGPPPTGEWKLLHTTSFEESDPSRHAERLAALVEELGRHASEAGEGTELRLKVEARLEKRRDGTRE